jgi:uncharacterized protein (TIGR02231 family)
MRCFPIVWVLVFVASAAAGAEIETRSNVDSVTVYPDGATVTRLIRVDLPAGDTTLIASDFPPGLDPSSLRVEGETVASVVIGSIDARAPKAVPPVNAPELEAKIEAARDQRSAVQDRIAAETARKNFAVRFGNDAPLGLGDKAEARPLAEWRAAFVAVSEDITAADNAIRELKLAERTLDREIDRLEAQARANPPRKFEVRIDLAADAATSGALRVSYVVRGARWVPIYDARLDTGGRDRKPTLELVRRTEIVQQTGEDWIDVALSVSTVRTAKGGAAPDLRPLIVGFEEPKQTEFYGRDDGTRGRLARSVAATPPPNDALAGKFDQETTVAPAPARERETALETGGFQAVFHVPGRVSVIAQEGAKSFRIASATISPDLLVRAAPALDPTAYLEASFKHAEEAPLLPGRVALYRDGTFVGRGALALAGKDELVNLGFGADDQIKVARIVQRKTEGTSGLISTSKTDEREFRITVRNGHDWPIKVVVEDQQPVSEVDDVQVELLPLTTKPTQTDARDRRGVLAWTLDMKGGEGREIALGWRVRWPAGKSVVFEPRS